MYPVPNTGKDIGESVSVRHDDMPQEIQLWLIDLHSYAPRSLPHGAHRQRFFDSCLLELKSWKYHLPVELQAKHLADKDTIPTHIS